VARPKRLDVVLALLGTSPRDPVSAEGLVTRLHQGGLRASPSQVLSALLGLEGSGHVHVARQDRYAFGLTPLGTEAAYDLGPGHRVDVTVVMIDLVGYVAFTAEHGDDAAHRAARQLNDAARLELTRRKGRVVKQLGDGVLIALPPRSDTAEAVAAIARRCPRPDGVRWSVRAAARSGRPIEHDGDLFGTDVNRVARLCEVAEPDQLVIALPRAVRGDDAAEQVTVRGLVEPVPVARVAVA
jgi:class 3 adenylate cyclase